VIGLCFVGSRRAWGERAALVTFAVVEAVALPVLFVLVRDRWFWNDDWAFLSHRLQWDPHVLFRNYYGHWSTLPNLVYWALWSTVGARYSVYQLFGITLHLVAAALLRWVMRRAGASPWMSTVIAGAFIFFGTGAENIAVAFQIVFVGALVFGLVQLLLADHDGGINRRDWLGLLAGLAALMCSDVAIPMVAAVGGAALMRRGWRAALFHTIPLAIVFVVWWSTAGDHPSSLLRATPSEVVRFVGIGIGAVFGGLGDRWFVGALLALMLGVGWWLLEPWRSKAVLARQSQTIALAVGAVLFFGITALERADPALEGLGPAAGRRSRYVYVAAAMLLPALAVAATAIVQRWRRLFIPVTIVLLIGVPGNVDRLRDYNSLFPFTGYRRDILALATSPFADQVPTMVVPVPDGQGMTIGWLRDAARAGRFPSLRTSAKSRATATIQLALQPSFLTVQGDCAALTSPRRVVFERGTRLTVQRGAVALVYTAPNGVRSAPRAANGTLVALGGPLPVQVRPVEAATVICSS
jgi:hypothetical protein